MEKLTNQEEDIMLRIWRLGRCAVKQIMELLPEPRPPYTTVASIVNNLKRKEYVKAERDGKGYVYSPLIAESDYKRKFPVVFREQLLQEFLQGNGFLLCQGRENQSRGPQGYHP